MPRCFSSSIQSEVAARCDLAAANRAGHFNAAAEQQKLFGQRRLTRIGMRNNGKRSPSRHFSFYLKIHFGHAQTQWGQVVVAASFNIVVCTAKRCSHVAIVGCRTAAIDHRGMDGNRSSRIGCSATPFQAGAAQAKRESADKASNVRSGTTANSDAAVWPRRSLGRRRRLKFHRRLLKFHVSATITACFRPMRGQVGDFCAIHFVPRILTGELWTRTSR